jgi:alpha/beta superfamily hydrolase
MEEKISFLSGTIDIEGLLDKNPKASRGVVIAHPHPLYGGNMRDFVVESIANAFRENGYATLKFNFRGVGRSRGHFDNGIGEQQDLAAAITCLRNGGIEKISLAGYSFGTWVIAHIDTDAWNIENVVFVSPPMGLMDFDGDLSAKHLKLVVTGSLDEFSPPHLIREKLERWGSSASLEIIPGSDHFYGGHHLTLESIISSFLRTSSAD